MKSMNHTIKNVLYLLAKRFIYKNSLTRRLVQCRYPYNLEVTQIKCLLDCINSTRNLNGNIIEIGVARGMTTVLLNQYLKETEDIRVYICIDTFESFTNDDIEYEITQRGKSKIDLIGFNYVDITTFRKSLEDNHLDNVVILKKDCKKIKDNDIGRVSVALLDVDLYLPVKKCLPILYKNLEPGGIIMVDDVKDDKIYDGAYQAYMEFCKSNGITPHYVGSKAGLLTK